MKHAKRLVIFTGLMFGHLLRGGFVKWIAQTAVVGAGTLPRGRNGQGSAVTSWRGPKRKVR